MSSETSLTMDGALSTLADRFFTAAAAGDKEALREIYSPNVRVWHNFDNAEQDLETNLDALSYVTKLWTGFRYEDVRRHTIDGGFVEQHTIHGEGPDGTPFASPAVVFVFLDDDGKVSRIEEYLDSSQLPPLS